MKYRIVLHRTVQGLNFDGILYERGIPVLIPTAVRCTAPCVLYCTRLRISGYGLKSVDWLASRLIGDTQFGMNRRSFFPKLQYEYSMAL